MNCLCTFKSGNTQLSAKNVALSVTMAFCRGRLFFETKSERRSQDSDIVQTLNFQDSDEGECYDGDSGVQDASMDSAVAGLLLDRGDITPESDKSCLWDSGLCSPTPGFSPRKRRSPRRDIVSPIPFGIYDSDEGDGTMPDPDSLTPPHKKLRSLRLYDTPHTPKSLLQKAQRRITRIPRGKQNQGQSASRLPLDPCRPQTNVNPFTPVPGSHTGHTGIKRARTDLDGYVLQAGSILGLGRISSMFLITCKKIC